MRRVPASETRHSSEIAAYVEQHDRVPGSTLLQVCHRAIGISELLPG